MTDALVRQEAIPADNARPGLAPTRLLLLTGPTEAAALGPELRRHLPGGQVVAVNSLEAIEANLHPAAVTRLIAFCTAVIVPARILARLDAGAFNIHPGPPNYPGRYPACWGAYEGVHRFGATLHAMTPRVDEGAIVAVEWFAVEPGIAHTPLSDRSFRAAVDLFRRFAPALATTRDLPTDPTLVWSGAKRRLADYFAMCRLPPDIDESEFARRRRAFADMPGAQLSVELHGHVVVWRAPG
jgi:methionyl-tRNA formyltransferase